MKILNSRYLAIAIALLMVGVLMWYFREIVTYVLISWVISMLGQPLMRILVKIKIGKIRMGASMAAILTMVAFISIFCFLGLIFIPSIIEQANNLSQVDVGAIMLSLQEPLNHLEESARNTGFLQAGHTIQGEIQTLFSGWLKPSSVSTLFQSVIAIAGTLTVGLVSVFFISFFFLKEQRLFNDFLTALLPQEYEAQTRDAINDTATLLTRYFSGLLLQMTFVVIFLLLTLGIMGFKSVFLIAVFAALINIVPYLGPMMGAIFAIFITISSNLGLNFYDELLPMLIKIGITFSIMQFFNDWIVQPLIFSNRVLAHPLEIFIVTLMGAKIGGIGGMILAIPAYTVFRVIARAFFNEFRLIQKMTDSLEEV